MISTLNVKIIDLIGAVLPAAVRGSRKTLHICAEITGICRFCQKRLYPMVCRSFSMALFSSRDTWTWLTPRIFAHCCWVRHL